MTTDDIIEKYDTSDEERSEKAKTQAKATKSFVASVEDVNAIKVQATQGEPVPAVSFEKKVAVDAPKTDEELATDYQYIRTNLYTITERAVEALNNLVQIADQSQHPRAYEVVALMVNSIASAQKDLMNIHKEKAKIDGISSKVNAEVINNNLFVGNTAQLDEIIKQMTSGKKTGDE